MGLQLTDNSAKFHDFKRDIYLDLLGQFNTILATLTGGTVTALADAFISKTHADTTPYNITVAPATSMTQAVTLQQLSTGLLYPSRTMKNVKTAQVGATVMTGASVAITDPFSAGNKLNVEKITITTNTPAAVSTTFTLYANGVQVFSKVFLATALPAVDTLLDLASGEKMPRNLTLPVTLTATMSAGDYDVTVRGSLNP